jgi:rSAM/selenodomain-associated transferase 1
MRVLMFTKYPAPGRVKTRLAKSIGLEHAAGLQTAFIRDELDMLRTLGAPVTLCCDPLAPLSEYRSLFGPHHFYAIQHGADLGERMLHALHSALEKSVGAVLIGSDLPDLPATHLRQAFAALKTAPLCLGPAPDGGFYLLGLSQPLPHGIFEAVPWGSAEVLTRTLANCEARGLHPQLLAPWPDVDTLPDLLDYAHRNRHALTHAMNYIRAHELAADAWKP